MSGRIEISGTKLPAETVEWIATFSAAAGQALGERLLSITLYGSALKEDPGPGSGDVDVLIVTDRIDVDTLTALAPLVSGARATGLEPLFLTENDLRTSCDVFPGRFLSMQEAYCVAAGRDVLAGLEVRRDHLRLRCEDELKNLLVKLRAHFVARGGTALDGIVASSAGPFFESIRMSLTLTDAGIVPRERVVDEAAARFGIDAAVFRDVLALAATGRKPDGLDGRTLFGRFLDMIGVAADVVDRMT
jgi:hypothetical protein